MSSVRKEVLANSDTRRTEVYVANTVMKQEKAFPNIDFARACTAISAVPLRAAVIIRSNLQLAFSIPTTNRVSLDEAQEMARKVEEEVLVTLAVKFGMPTKVEISLDEKRESGRKQKR